jgi:hypothetical protein
MLNIIPLNNGAEISITDVTLLYVAFTFTRSSFSTSKGIKDLIVGYVKMSIVDNITVIIYIQIILSNTGIKIITTLLIMQEIINIFFLSNLSIKPANIGPRTILGNARNIIKADSSTPEFDISTIILIKASVFNQSPTVEMVAPIIKNLKLRLQLNIG